MTIQLAYKQLLAELYSIYDTREAANITDWIIEHVTGQPKIDRIVYKDMPVSIEQQQTLKTITADLLQHKPVQYALNEAWFFGMKLFVNENVLIPRPETEELVEWVGTAFQNAEFETKNLVDVGTGSGCIPVALKKKLPAVVVHAIDVSVDALEVACRNVAQQNTAISFHQLDFLDEEQWGRLPLFDIIVSNPPYVKKSEAEEMRSNVLKYEPHIALFVPDEDPLQFYRAIGEFAQTHLTANGSIFVEINELLWQQVTQLFKEYGFASVTLKKDLQGKDRMIKAGR